jgi:hypothetical protein
VAAFRRGLAETGTSEGQGSTVEYRWALGDYAKLPSLASELVGKQVNVLVAVGGEPLYWPPRPQPRRFQSSAYSSAIRSNTD